MTSEKYEENVYGHDLDILIILYKSCVSISYEMAPAEPKVFVLVCWAGFFTEHEEFCYLVIWCGKDYNIAREG